MRYFTFYIAIMIVMPGMVYGQESILSLLKSDLRKADELYDKSAYFEAIDLYTSQLHKNNDVGIKLKIASSYFQLNHMEEAVTWYQDCLKQQHDFNDGEMLHYASALHASGDYENAIKWYESYLQVHPENLEVATKIWQLKNIKYLFEDSTYFNIKLLPIHTNFDEYGPAIYQNTLIYTSNRPEVSIVQRLDATLQTPFFHWYVSKFNLDSLGILNFAGSKAFAPDIHAKYHKGTVSFDEHRNLMVFSRTEDKTATSLLTSKLFFAQKSENGKWEEISDFPYNSDSHSTLHPYLAKGGNSLYFTSDMPGGLGGTDLYVSEFLHGNWTKPKNLGPEINTSENDGHPYLYQDMLYFSSNGHPGLGGLDILKVNLSDQQLEVINPGYPLNTHFDDFGLVLDSSGLNGFFASNRHETERINDNLYQVQLSEHTFPLIVEGKISFKRNALSGIDSESFILSNAHLELIDKKNQLVVQEADTDEKGHFKIEIPSESQYLLKVGQKDFGTAVVSMEIPKNYQNFLKHDIVIVEGLFK